jgi:hypothetical protein
MADRQLVIADFEDLHYHVFWTVFLSIHYCILMLSVLVISYFACSCVSIYVKIVLNLLLSAFSPHSVDAGIGWFKNLNFP